MAKLKQSKDQLELTNMTSNEQEIYLLLKDTDTVPINPPSRKRRNPESSNGPVHAIKGSLVKRNHQESVHGVADDSYIYIDDPSQQLTVQRNNLYALTDKQFEILYAIHSKNDRFKFYQDKLFLKVMDLKLEDLVKVRMETGCEYGGTVKYCGPVPGENGRHFGIELKKPAGDIDGKINGLKLFKCSKNHGTVVSADKITEIIYSKRDKDIVSVEMYNKFHVESRVVFFVDDKPNHGTIRFLGYTSKNSDQIYAGIEPDKKESFEKLGNLLKFSSMKKKVFHYKSDSIIVEVEALLDEGTYQSKEPQPQEVSADKMTGKRQLEISEFKKTELNGVEGKPRVNVKVNSTSFNSLPSTISSTAKNKLDQLKNTFKGTSNERLNEIQDEKRTHDERINELTKSDKNVPIPSVNHNEPVYETIADNNAQEIKIKKKNKPVECSMVEIEENRTTRDTKNILSNTEPEFDAVLVYNAESTSEQNPEKTRSIVSEQNVPTELTKEVLQKNPDTFESHKPPEIQSGDKKKKDEQQMELTIDTMVEVHIKPKGSTETKTCHGVVRWVGYHPGITDKLVGLELEAYEGQCDGEFKGKRYFTCPQMKGTFIKAKKCRPDKRFVDDDQTFVHSVVGQSFGHDVFNQDHGHRNPTAPPPDQLSHDGWMPGPMEYKENVLPPSELSKDFLGKGKGIQGHHNSCYMDATLFAMFSFAHVFDVALHRKRREYDMKDYDKVQSILKERIVNPLRKDGFVHRNNVMGLRECLNEHANIGGFMTDEKDPEEFVILLFEKVLKLEPFITIKQNRINLENTALLYQLFPRMDEDTQLPSIQFLLELSMINSDLKLKESPSVMILQMPRFGQQKMFERVFISPTLDVTPIMYTLTLPCEVCGEPSVFHCPQCACGSFGPEKVMVYLCDECEELVHKRADRKDHEPHSLDPGDVCTDVHKQRNILELFAVVSINTSHYVAFVKCGERDDADWVFFDSMADREGGDQDGYNIPQVTKLDRLKDFLYGKPKKVTELATKKVTGDDKKQSEQDKMILRFYEDASLCFYRNKRFSMYR